ncbi:MAG TPA: hypothetical protein VFY22_13820 [Hydrogenophaga sp.]|nr:hypothetical protein [Hydrogenophaga sp.]
MRTASHQGTGASLALTLALLSPIEHASAQSMAALSVSAPSGGCRLTLLADGTGFMNYGAAPWRVSVAPDTFRFNELGMKLHEDSYAQRDRATRGEIVGTVSLPGSSELRFIDDARVVRPLLERAWSARLAPAPPFESEEHHQRIAGACGFHYPTHGASRSHQGPPKTPQ